VDSTGTLRSGKPFRYRGVTVIEGDEERLTGVRTYYDSRFLRSGGTPERTPRRHRAA
jgi:ketosteroid isomerase-like protein